MCPGNPETGGNPRDERCDRVPKGGVPGASSTVSARRDAGMMTLERRIGRPREESSPRRRPASEGLDEITGGGLPVGRPTLVCGSAGCGKTLFGIEFLVRGAVEYGEPGVLVSFEENTPGRADQEHYVASPGLRSRRPPSRGSTALHRSRPRGSERDRGDGRVRPRRPLRPPRVRRPIGGREADRPRHHRGALLISCRTRGSSARRLRRLFRWLKEARASRRSSPASGCEWRACAGAASRSTSPTA